MPQPAWCCNGYPGQQRPCQRPCRLLCPLPALWQSTLCLSWSAASLGQHGSSHGGRPEAASRPVPNVERCCEHSFSVSSHRPCWDLTDSRKPVPAWGGDPFEVCEAWIYGGGMAGAFRRYKKRSTKGTPLPSSSSEMQHACPSPRARRPELARLCGAAGRGGLLCAQSIIAFTKSDCILVAHVGGFHV